VNTTISVELPDSTTLDEDDGVSACALECVATTVTELTLAVPGTYMLEDHHITRLEKGAFAHLRVDGPDNLPLFEQNYHHDASGTAVTQEPAQPFTLTEEPLPNTTDP
jgi:hypothetical protein